MRNFFGHTILLYLIWIKEYYVFTIDKETNIQATVLYSSAGVGGSASVAANLHDCVDVDYYEITFVDPSLVTITNEFYSTEFEVYDANNQLIGSSAYQLSLDLDGGTYYIKVVRDSILNGDTFNLSYQLGVNVQNK